MRVRRLLTCALAVVTVGALGTSPAAAIANGAVAEEGQFPYAVKLTMTGIQPTGGTAYDSACSAALISETWIMTAGHCFHDGDRNRVSGEPRYGVTATLGTANTASNPGQTRSVTWVEQSPENDIAVARLSEPVTDLAPVALGTRQPGRGQVLSFAGWGATSSSGTWSEQLHWGEVKVSSVRPTTVLVKGYWPAKDTSACPYDSGAPYVDTSGPAPVLVSVESAGPACPHRRDETTARVDVVVDWVRTVVTDLR
ncbi:trypsin-like serine protease [Blastococcus saxobsidens]|uniref:Secreted esterase n=1 Tax=Blastococcus saxobsidens (strain DD2) TaxID=1146883 RepID=H6RV63_BLASD|nr:trypsin-like serine protease [Blastococcus saxobsidens]CCG05782.1 Secreted esterase [Blastococcus saxobsidens DD2]